MAIEHPGDHAGVFAAGDLTAWAQHAAEQLASHLSRDFLFFILFGGIAAIVNLAIGAAFYGTPGLAATVPYWLAVGIGATGGLFVNFILNYFYNFRFRGRSALAQFRTFCIVAAVGILLTALFSNAFLPVMSAHGVVKVTARLGLGAHPDFLAHACAIALVTFYSYAAHKCFTFNVGIRGRVRGLMLGLHG